MARETGNGDHATPRSDTGVKRRKLLRFGTVITAFTGASAISAISAGSAEAGPGDKNPPTAYVPMAEKGAPLGVAPLDMESKIPSALLPDLSANIDLAIEESPELTGPYSAPSARLEILEPATDARRYVGENTDTGLDVTVQLQAWLDSLTANAGDHQREAFLPAGTYNISAPLVIPDGTKLRGQGSSGGSKNKMASRIKAMPGFVGAEMLRAANAGAGTSALSSWHWGGIERICLIGIGITGPNGIYPGSMGETSFIRDTLIQNVKDGFYFFGDQASAHLENISVHGCRYGINADKCNSTIRVFGLSGDNNTSLLRVKGGVSLSVLVNGMKSESYNTGTGDPVVLLDDFEGSLVVNSAWADAQSARADFLKIQKTTATNNPKVVLFGLDINGFYTNLINDTILRKTMSGNPAGIRRPAVFWNTSVTVGGNGSIILENGLSLRARNTAAAYQPILVAGTDNSTEIRPLGSGGGRLAGLGGTGQAVKWGTAGELAFHGATPIAKQTGTPAAATDAATTMALANDLRAKLIALGLIS